MFRMDLESRNTEKFRLRRAKQKEIILFDHFHEISLKKLHMTKTLKKTLVASPQTPEANDWRQDPEDLKIRSKNLDPDE